MSCSPRSSPSCSPTFWPSQPPPTHCPPVLALCSHRSAHPTSPAPYSHSSFRLSSRLLDGTVQPIPDARVNILQQLTGSSQIQLAGVGGGRGLKRATRQRRALDRRQGSTRNSSPSQEVKLECRRLERWPKPLRRCPRPRARAGSLVNRTSRRRSHRHGGRQRQTPSTTSVTTLPHREPLAPAENAGSRLFMPDSENAPGGIEPAACGLKVTAVAPSYTSNRWVLL